MERGSRGMATRGWIIGAGLVSALLWALLTWISQGLPAGLVENLAQHSPSFLRGFVVELEHGFHYDVDNNDMPTVAFLVLQGLLWLILCGLVWRLWKKSVSRWDVWLILGFALLFRVILLGSVPIHENDFYRYLWDGKSLRHGINPYLYEPAALFMYEHGIKAPFDEPVTGVTLNGREWTEADGSRLEHLMQLRDENPDSYYRIGHWQISTIYPPVAQAVFVVSSALFGDSLLGLRIVLLGFDVGCILLILALLTYLRKPRANLLIYAWSPLVLVEFTNSAHYDAVPVFFILLAIWCFVRQRLWGGVFSLAASGLSKFFGLFILPILYPPRPAQFWRYLAVGAIMVIPFVPFVFWQGAGWSQVLGGLSSYTTHWQNNSGIFLVVDKLIGAETYLPAKIVIAIGYLIFLARISLTPTPNHETLLRKCFWAMGVFFVLNPTAFPWYYGWVLPFVCFFPRCSWMVLMPLLSLYYLDFHDSYSLSFIQFASIPLINWIIWGTFGIVWIAEQSWAARCGERRRGQEGRN